MKKIKYVVFAFVILCLISWGIDGCNQRRQKDELVKQLSEYKLENKHYRSERQKDSSLIVTQTQTIMSQKDAIRLGLLEKDKRIKSIESQLQAKIRLSVVEKDVPFIPTNYADTSGWVRNKDGVLIKTDSISVPQDYGLAEKWFRIKGTVRKSGLKIDTLEVPAKFTVTYGKEKSGLLNLGRTPVVQIKSDNPYVDVTSLNNIVVKKPKSFFASPVFFGTLGFILGIFIAK